MYMSFRHQIHIPLDVVERVFEDLFYDDQLAPDYATLSACSKVCTLWRAPAQKLLFRQVVIPGRQRPKEHLDGFRAALYEPTDHSRTLASHVRRVQVDLRNADADEGNTTSDLTDLLSRCHRVYEVSLTVQGPHELDSDVIAALKDAHQRSYPTCIRALNLYSCGILSPILYQLLFVWPTIRHLRLGTEIAALLPKVPPKVQLYELVLWRIPRPHIMAWLLSSSPPGSLRILEMNTAPDYHYDDVLAMHYEHLQSLRLFRHTSRTGTVARRFTRLRELVVTQPSSFLPLGKLPQSLEHLSFRYFIGTGETTGIPLEPVISAVDKLPKLRLITCDAAVQNNKRFDSLKKLCQERGVNISSNVIPIRTVSSTSCAPF
jgi:hypothetical protein